MIESHRYELLTVNLTADSLWAAFSDVLQSAVELFVPSKVISGCVSRGLETCYKQKTLPVA